MASTDKMDLKTCRAQLKRANDLVTELSSACRQTNAFLSGISCLDQKRLKQVLQRAIRSADKYINA